MVITWEQFDGPKFQQFCNELLLLEVSKHAHVFSAPGPDGGIDQLFSGEYDGKKGNWRFQDKFHACGQAGKDWSALKRDVANDIRDNYAGEDFIVFITNLDLNPKKEGELLAIVKEALDKRSAICEPIIWHKAFLNGIMPSHPVLYHWHWGNGSTSLKPFREFFKASLASITVRGMSFQNEFFGREEDLDFLDAFLASEDGSSLAIVSNGGYGKTRLCIELMRRVEQERNDWLPLVLVHHGYNSNEFARLLEEQGRLLILLDNANEVPIIFDDVKRQVEATNGRVKLIITTRNTLFNQTLGRMSSYNSNIKRRQLGALAPDVTLKMLQAELPHIEHRNLLALRNISRGVPNVILELVYALRNGENINTISSHNFFATAVLNIVREAANGIFHDTGIPQEKTIDLLQLLSIISPLNNEATDIAFIAAMINLPEEKVETIINCLSEAGLVGKTRAFSIKPDPYSDIILAAACKRSMRLIERIKDQQGAEKYVENIIKNLAEAEIPSGEKELFTQQMLRDYFATIANPATPPQKLKGAVELARDLSYTKPASAIIAVNKWIELLAVRDAPVHKQTDGFNQRPLTEAINEIVASILGNIVTEAFTSDSTKLPDLFALIEDFIRASGYFKALHACFGFRHWHCKCAGFRVEKCCGLQHFLKEKVVQYLSKSNDQTQIQIALEGHDMLMELEFNGETYVDNYTMTFHWANYQLPDCVHARQFRIESVQAVIEFYKSGRATPEQKQKLLSELTRQLFRAAKSSSERYDFNTDDELNLILSFLKELLNTQPELWEKIKIADATKHWGKKELRPEFAPQINGIRALAKASSSLKEELELLLGSHDYFDSRANAGKTCLRILKDYRNDEQFQEDFISVSTAQNSMGTPFQECLAAFVAHEPAFSKSLFDRVMQHYPDQIPPYALLIRANYKDEGYFSETTETILSKYPEHIGSVVWMMIHGRNGDADCRRPSDLDIFERAIDQNDQRAIYFLDSGLIQYIYIDKDRTLALYNRMIPLLHKDEVTIVFHHIYSNETVTKVFPQELKALLYRHLEVLPVDETFGGDEILSFVEDKFGIEELYTFVRTWVEYKVANSPYGLFSFGDHCLGNKAREESLEAERFIHILRKFIMLLPEQFESKTERQLLKVFRPTQGFTAPMRERILALLEEHKADEQVLTGLAKAISIFPPMTEPFVLTMCEIADAYVACTAGLPTSRQVADFFGHDFYYNTGGVKTKSGHGPFPVDAQKKELFEKVIAENHFSAPVTQFLNKCLQNVLRDIEREVESDRERLMWQ